MAAKTNKRAFITGIAGFAGSWLAERLLADAGGSVKIALVMHKLGCDLETARRRLNQAGGFVRRCFEDS